MFVPRKIPKTAKKFELSSNDSFGMINLRDDNGDNSHLIKEIQQIDDCDKIFIKDNNITIYFPIFDFFYYEEFFNENGFTLGEILLLTSKIGYKALAELWINDKSFFGNDTTFTKAAEHINQYAVCDFFYIDNKIYIDVEN